MRRFVIEKVNSPVVCRVTEGKDSKSHCEEQPNTGLDRTDQDGHERDTPDVSGSDVD